MTARWFRFYERTVDNPKAQRLPPAIFKGWVNLLCVASRNNGVVSAADLPFSLRISPAQVGALTKALIAAKLLDATEEGYSPHEWAEHQFVEGSSAAKRQKRYRDRNKRDGTVVTQHVTHTVTGDGGVTVQEKDSKSEKDSSVPKGTGAEAPQLFGEGLPKKANGKPHPAVKIDLKKQVYDRGKEVFGCSAGGIITNVLKAKENKYAKALALIEDAAEKRDPVSWINAWLWEHGPPGIQVGPMAPAL